MTVFETLSLIISVAGAIGIVVSLWLVYRQTGIFNRQLMESVSQSMTDYSLEISRLFLQHPDLRPYFFAGQTIDESHPDYLRAEAVAEVILDIFWIMGNGAKRIRIGAEFFDDEGRTLWATYISDCFATSPILTSFLTKRKDGYGQEMTRRMEEGLARARQQTTQQTAQPVA